MGIYETYSKRKQARERAGQADIYQYDEIPKTLKVQVLHIWDDLFGESDLNFAWKNITGTLSRELGLIGLGTREYSSRAQCREFLLGGSTDHSLDIIEYSMRVAENIHANDVSADDDEVDDADADDGGGYALYLESELVPLLSELNIRFRENGVGYSYYSGEIIRIDSEYTHDEIVRPSIHLLSDPSFSGPEQEFLAAHEHYRHGRNKEAITDALKAFESMMRAICDKRKWTYGAGATAKELIQVLFANALIPSYLQNQFTSLRSLLESGVPTVRNRVGGHGQGAIPVGVPDHLVAYALHLAGANILLLGKADKALP